MKKGKIAWDYLAVIVLAVAVLIVMIIFSGKLRDKAVEGWRSFISVIGKK